MLFSCLGAVEPVTALRPEATSTIKNIIRIYVYFYPQLHIILIVQLGQRLLISVSLIKLQGVCAFVTTLSGGGGIVGMVSEGKMR